MEPCLLSVCRCNFIDTVINCDVSANTVNLLPSEIWKIQAESYRFETERRCCSLVI